MRVGLIGDIHGDIRALEATLRHLERLGVDCLACTGDLVGYGIAPDAVVALVRELGIPCVMGNHDRWALERRRVIGLRGWKPAILKDATWEYLADLPPGRTVSCDGRTIVLFHGSPESDMEYVTPYKPLPASVEQFLGQNDADLLVLGHSHIPMIERLGGRLIINPGSLHGVSGVQTSYSFALADLEELSVRIFDIRLGRIIRRDPVFLGDE